MKKSLLSLTLITYLSLSAFAQLENRNWLLGGSIGVSAINNTSVAAPSVFVGKVFSDKNVLGAGLSFQYFDSDGESVFRNQSYTIEFQSYKNISEEFPLSFFYAPSVFVQSLDSEGTSLGAGFRLGLSYRPLDSWLIQIAPLQTRVQFGTPNGYNLGLGTSNVNVVWLFGK